MPIKALFSPSDEAIFRGVSEYHPPKNANLLIFNELRVFDLLTILYLIDYQALKFRGVPRHAR